jgi:hypothetical protein
MNWRALVVTVGLLASAVPSLASPAPQHDPKLEAAYQLLRALREDVFEATKTDLVVDQSVDWYRQGHPGASDKELQLFRSALRRELTRYSMQLISMRAQYYANHFSLAEIREWTGLVSSKTGQKIVSVAPVMMRDFYAVDLAWHKLAMERAMAEVGRAKAGANRP